MSKGIYGDMIRCQVCGKGFVDCQCETTDYDNAAAAPLSAPCQHLRVNVVDTGTICRDCGRRVAPDCNVETKNAFRVGQVVMYDREGKKRGVPIKILEVVEEEGQFFYRVDRKNCVAENMIRALTEEEKGKLPSPPEENR